MRWSLRILALGHYAWGGALLLVAAWFVVGAIRTLPHMSTGTVWTNLPGALMFVAFAAGPFAALGSWLLVLGRRAWTGRGPLRTALCWTHGALLPLGAFAIVVGLQAMRQAEVSAARGGGIMGSLAALPLLFGEAILVLSVPSLAVALLVLREVRADAT
jgi:hypothetical protein